MMNEWPKNYACEGQMTIFDFIPKLPKCEECQYEVCRPTRGMGLPMCNHPLMMASHHGKFGGKFTAHYDKGVDRPSWCPLERPDLY